MIVFKHQSDFYRTFDLDIFQHKLLARFMPEYLRMTAEEKEAIYYDYIRSLEDDINESEPVVKTEDGYFVTKNAVKASNIISKPREVVDTRRKKKKKDPFKKDFYKFQVKNIKDQISLEGLGHAYMSTIHGSEYIDQGDDEPSMGLPNFNNEGDGDGEFEGNFLVNFRTRFGKIGKSWIFEKRKLELVEKFRQDIENLKKKK